MGIYVYTLRKRSIKIELSDGEVVTAVCMAYAYKDRWSFGVGNRSWDTKVARLDSFGKMAQEYWNSREKVPNHVVIYDPDDKEEQYSGVYRVAKLLSKDYDTPGFTGKYLGHVLKERKGRTVSYKLIPKIKKVDTEDQG